MADTVMPAEQFGRYLVLKSVETKGLALADFLKESKETPAVLLMLDNLESVTGTGQAVGTRLGEQERETLARVLQTLMRSSLKILLGSRAGEEWLGRLTFKDRIYELEGLDRVSAYTLAAKILDGVPVEEGEDFKRLMEILAGFPLALEIILPNLGQRSAREMCEILSGAGVAFPGPGAPKPRGGDISEQIFKCINISFTLLTPEAQQRVLVFAPFTSFLNTEEFDVYLQALQGSGAFAELTLAGQAEALAQAECQGLVKEVYPKCFALQPVFPFFLGEQVGRSFPGAERAALDRAFCSYMTRLAKGYNSLMTSKEAGEKQVGFALFRQDRENLYKALHRVLDRQGDFYPLYDVFQAFYHRQPLYQEAIDFMADVVRKLDRYAQKDTDFLENYAYVVGNLGTYYSQVKHFSEAKQSHSKALALLQQAGKRKETSFAYHSLGNVAVAERDLESAKAHYRDALKIYQEFNDRFSQADTYHQMGMVAEEERDWESAKENYREALKIQQEFNDRCSQASTYHNLGAVCQEERDFPAAKAHYREALKIKQEFNDRYEQAGTYHQLGRVAQEERDWESAKENYREALQIKQEFNDRFSQASTYHQLGRVAAEENDYILSLGYYTKALEIFSEYKDKYNLEIVIRKLSRLLQQSEPAWVPLEAIAALEVQDEIKALLVKLVK
jgi:tetratricopeptide (TPR) repeat protein